MGIVTEKEASETGTAKLEVRFEITWFSF